MSIKAHSAEKSPQKKEVEQVVQEKAVQPVIISERVQGNYDIALVLSKVKKFI